MRAIRRAHRERLLKKRLKYWGSMHKTPTQLGILVNTPTPCSCRICGNPRKFFNEKTMQERRAEQSDYE